MAFWSRLKQSKPKFHLVLNEFRRCYFSNHFPNVSNLHISPRISVPASNSHGFLAQSNRFEFLGNVRFYAAPAQVNQQQEESDKTGPRLNEEITTQFVRLVTDEGHSVVSRSDALARAKKLKLDLVEVDRVARPAVCKIMDYNRERYLQQMKEKEKGRAKSKSELKKGAVKEVRFAGKIKQNDLQLKADMVKRLMEKGYRVKCTAIDPTDNMDLATLLSRFCTLIEDVSITETKPQVEKKQAFVVVRHVKFGPAKKSGKKASNVSETTSTTQPKDGVSLSDKNGDTVKTLLEHNPEVDSGEMLEEDDDRDADFDIMDEVNAESPELEGPAYITSRKFLESVPANTTASPMPTEVPKTWADMNGGGGRNSMNIVPRVADQGRQIPYGMNSSQGMRQPQQDPRSSVGCSTNNSSDGPGARDPLHPLPQTPFSATRPQFNASSSSQVRPNHQVEEGPKQDSPSKNYGIFSMPRVDNSHQGQSTPLQTNRYKKSNPSDSATGVSSYRNR